LCRSCRDETALAEALHFGRTTQRLDVSTTAGYLGVAVTNGAADVLTRSLAVELAPIRVNAISPGVVDTGAWDSLGEDGKAAYVEKMRTANPAGRIGTAGDIADAVLFAMTNRFLTGVTLRVDGGEPLS
jgi:NAD(P)-dependent dehydrogenase (short-subunit alcohol dehydrogenase family)